MRKPINAPTVRAFMSAREDLDVLRIHYCYQIGSTFVNLALMEDTIIRAMSICDRIRVTDLLGPDASNWSRLIDKTNKLQSSTLGNLISVLSKHSVVPADLDYLKWVKAKRDFFVHRFFHQGDWPGELADEEIEALCRKLLYLEIIFVRASHRIWRIFGRANLMHYQDLGDDGVLMMNLDLLQREDGSSDE
jgi:hypothetical protein